MLVKFLLTSALVVLSLCADNVFAASHGRFAQKARDRADRGKQAAERRAPDPPKEGDFRFLTDATKRKFVVLFISIIVLVIAYQVQTMDVQN